MRPPNSSTSSSKWPATQRSAIFGHAEYRRRVIEVIIFAIMALMLLDVAVGLAFRPPPDPHVAPNALQAYFDYGRSVEGKLRRMVGANAAQDASIVEAGWVSRECDRSLPTPAGRRGIDIYGMSFTNRIAYQMERLEPDLAIEQFGGPAAPPNHSYACFVQRIESGHALAPIQIIGVLASSLRRMVTLSGLTTSFESPQPFTYPRFTLGQKGRLVPHWSSIRSPENLRVALADREKWRTFLGELAAEDAFYAPEMMSANFTDHSVLLRMIRRAWGQRLLRSRTTSLLADTGSGRAPDIAPVIRVILVDFAIRARAADKRPIVILIEDKGYGGLLTAMLAPTLQAAHIEFVATGDIAAPDDPANFLSDGHFTPAIDAEIARATLNLLHLGL